MYGYILLVLFLQRTLINTITCSVPYSVDW